MIDLTPLDVRKKRGDFKKNLRGYDSQEVDTFLELVAERLEEVVMENLQLRERVEGLQKQVASQSGREQAVQEALVSAQELGSEMKGQAQREADLILSEARTEARRLVAEAEAEARTLLRDTERRLEEGQTALQELERRRIRFLKAFRGLLERELDVVQVEEERAPLEDRPIDLDLGGGLLGSAEPSDDRPETDPGRDEAPGDEAPGEEASFSDAGSDEGSAQASEEISEAPARSAADEVREALAGMEAAALEGDATPSPEHGSAEEGPDETLSLSFDETPSPGEDDPRG